MNITVPRLIEMLTVVSVGGGLIFGVGKFLYSATKFFTELAKGQRDLTTAVTRLTERIDEQIVHRLEAHETRITVLEDWRDHTGRGENS